jgi:hypothetical protein
MAYGRHKRASAYWLDSPAPEVSKVVADKPYLYRVLTTRQQAMRCQREAAKQLALLQEQREKTAAAETPEAEKPNA